MLHRNAKIAVLARVPLFERCSRRELERVAAVADEVEVPSGRQLTVEGKTGSQFIVLVDGEAEVRRKGRRIAVLRSGDFLGEIALVTNRTRTASVTTTAPSRLLALTPRDFRGLLRDVPSLAPKILQALGERLPAD